MAQGFFATITAAIRDIQEHGFDTLARIQNWTSRIRTSARASMVPESVLEGTLNRTLTNTYEKLIVHGGYKKIHPGVSVFGVERLTPNLRAELARRTMLSANLIKLNRTSMIEKTTQRFEGWASSVPPGGSAAVEVKEVKENVSKALKQLPFEERRVMIDQGHKFVSTLNDTIAKGNNALAMTWHSRWRVAGYNYRKDHKERDGKVYLLKGSWALEQGLIKPGPEGYIDDITQPAEEVYCQCSGKYIYNLRGLPEYLLTEKGKKALDKIRT